MDSKTKLNNRNQSDIQTAFNKET